MIGALVAQAHRWHAFNWHWKRLLAKEGIEFSHIVDMENKKPPFSDWGMARTRPFVRRAARRINKNCDFSFTAVLARDDYEAYYLSKLTSRAAKDSCLGLCARAIIESVATEVIARFGNDALINFVFEDSQHFEGIRRIFNELKDFVPSIAGSLGTITPGRRTEFAGLQAADLIASLSRRSEPTAEFIDSTEAGSSAIPRDHGRPPMFHAPLNAQSIPSFCAQAEAISLERRGRRRARGFANRRARQGS